MPSFPKLRHAAGALALLLSTTLPALAEPFTIAVIPDTQNYVDYRQQKANGYVLDGSEIFLSQMRYVAEHARSKGGDIVFSIGLGDMWQHDSLPIDPGHAARGFKATSVGWAAELVRPETKSFEIPLVAKGYGILGATVPFSVVPGNHDFDSQWLDGDNPPDPTKPGELKNGIGMVGGLASFKSVFGPDSTFFKGKPWFVGSSPSGGDTAYLFEAGGYRFLEIGFQFEPPTESLIWAQSILKRYPGVPTIISTHGYLKTPADRINGFNPDLNDNNGEMVWQKFVSQNDQIFLVLSGHWCAQARRRDENRFGHTVDQVLSDYQCRWQAAKDAGAKEQGVGLGDGWLRLLQFDLDSAVPTIRFRTYSTLYKSFSTDLPTYAQWYKPDEWPMLSDEEYLRQDDFTLRLDDFRARFAAARTGAKK